MHVVSLVLAVLFTTISFAQGYKLTRSYKGNDFINDFDFWDGKAKQDPTGTPDHPSGAIYLPRTQAKKQGLVKVNNKGRFVLSVDSTHKFKGKALRPSVRITSKKSFRHGLLILDAVHLPFGKGTWPAFWINGADGNWPNSGELDIIEGINDNNKNSISYHTGPDVCRYDLTTKQTGIFNRARGTDCFALNNNNEACGNVDPNTTSYGNGANKVGGGVWILEWNSRFIKTWHFERNKIPKDITLGKPNPKGWGTPVTHLSSKECDIDKAYGPQSIVFNIELCGTWAGSLFKGGAKKCVDFVQKNPGVFKTAFFEINSLKLFQ